jgi:hypothetical protein
MAIKFTNIFHCKTLQNLPKMGLWIENIPSGNPALEASDFHGIPVLCRSLAVLRLDRCHREAVGGPQGTGRNWTPLVAGKPK